MGSAPASLADNPFLITLLLEMQTTIFLRTEMSRKTEYVHNPCFLSANILKILGVFAENQIKQLYDSLVAAPYGEYVHGYGTQKPNGFKYKSNAQTLFNKVVELNEKCRPSYIDEQTIFQLSHTLEKEVEHVVGTYEEAIKPNAAQKRWQELDDKMNRATRQIHLDIYNLLSYIEETSHE